MSKEVRTDSVNTSENSEYSRKLGERIRALWSLSGFRQDEFAISLGIHPGTLNNYIQGKRLPTAKLIERLVSKYGASPAWLISGEGVMHDSSRTTVEEFTCNSPCNAPLSYVRVVDQPLSPVVASTKPQYIEGLDGQFTVVPMVEARLAAGMGSLETGDEVIGSYAFRTDFLTRKGQPASMVLMRVAGDSMEPQIKNDDMVLIDQSKTRPIAGRLFAVGVEDAVYIKMMDTLPGKIVLKSYNKSYAPLEINTRGDMVDGIRIIGRAVWVCRELK